jgi:hypothetical protein
MLVQIAIAGDYQENYGADEWDGTGECPQHWKCKFGGALPIVSNVAPENITRVMVDVTQAMDAFSYRNEFARMSYYGARVYPNQLAEHEFIYFDYKDYDMIRSISRAEIDAFNAVSVELHKRVMADPFAAEVTEPEPLPYEEYDIV